jgi:hypothetical protein
MIVKFNNPIILKYKSHTQDLLIPVLERGVFNFIAIDFNRNISVNFD